MLMGSVAGAVEVIENVVRPLSPQVIVPGHGDVCGPEAIDDLHRAYADLDAALERGAKLDTAAVFLDMVTYNGGKPLSCHA